MAGKFTRTKRALKGAKPVATVNHDLRPIEPIKPMPYINPTPEQQRDYNRDMDQYERDMAEYRRQAAVYNRKAMEKTPAVQRAPKFGA